MDRSELLATMSRMKSMANASGALTREQALAIEASQSGETPLMGTPPPPPPLSASAAAAVAAAWEVELGFLEKGALPADWAIVDGGKAGGRPAWLDPLAAPPPAALRCGVCRTEMTFLVQCYAPLSGVPSAYHRVLYVWCCRNGTCLRENIGGAGAVKVFRCQLPRDHAYRGAASLNLGDCDAALPPRATLSADLTAAVECSRVEGNAAFKAQRWTDAIAAYAGALAHFDAARAEVWPSWDEKDDGDGGDELGGSSLWDAASAATERSLLCNLAAAHLKLGDAATALVFADRAVHADPSFAKAHYRRRVALQTLGRTREAASAHRRTLELQQAAASASAAAEAVVIAGEVPALQERAIVFELEPVSAAEDAVRALAAAEEAAEDEEELGPDEDELAWRTATSVTAPGRNQLDDPATLSFHKRMACEPSQCVRYHTGWWRSPADDEEEEEEEDGLPPLSPRPTQESVLWAGSQRRAKPHHVPRCVKCGGERACELQLMPQLLYLLNVERDAYRRGREGEDGGVEEIVRGEPMDWETIAIYNCPNPACVASSGAGAAGGAAEGAAEGAGGGGGSYEELFAWVQADASAVC